MDTGDANFLFSEFSIGLFSPFTHPRLHFHIYVWLHLKHLCVDIYAWFTSHLCVVLHFLIFVTYGWQAECFLLTYVWTSHFVKKRNLLMVNMSLC